MSIPIPIMFEIKKLVKENYPTRPDKHEELIQAEIDSYNAINGYAGIPCGFDRNLILIEARKHHKSYVRLYDYLLSEIDSFKKFKAFHSESVPVSLLEEWKKDAQKKCPKSYTDQLAYCEMKCNQYLYPYDPFVNKIRNLCKSEVTGENFIKLLIKQLKDEHFSGMECGYLYKDYIDPILQMKLNNYRSKLEGEVSEKLNKKRIELEKKYASQYAEKIANIELDAIYNKVENNLLSDPGFFSIALKKVQDDVCHSKQQGEFPRLYEATLNRCDQELIIKFLVEEFHEDLIERFAPALMASLLKTHKSELLQKAKDEVLKDKKIINKIKEDIKQDLVRQMFG